jgi:hypothetical protein
MKDAILLIRHFPYCRGNGPILSYLERFKGHHSPTVIEAYDTDANQVYARVQCDDDLELSHFIDGLKRFKVGGRPQVQNVIGLIVLQ